MELRRYLQGRYFCHRDGTFTLTIQPSRDIPKVFSCPACGHAVALIAECSGRSADVQFGTTAPMRARGDTPGSWYDENGIHRASKNARHGGRPRQHDRCEPCNTVIYASLASARCTADIATSRMGKKYDALVCPHGNGCHVFLVRGGGME